MPESHRGIPAPGDLPTPPPRASELDDLEREIMETRDIAIRESALEAATRVVQRVDPERMPGTRAPDLAEQYAMVQQMTLSFAREFEKYLRGEEKG